MQKGRGLGLHLMFTLVGCSMSKLCDRDGILNLFSMLQAKIGMTLVPPDKINTNPIIFNCKNNKNPDNWGYSVFSLLFESHLSGHLWPEYNNADFDVFSCYHFDIDVPLTLISEFFEGEIVNVRTVTRGDDRFG